MFDSYYNCYKMARKQIWTKKKLFCYFTTKHNHSCCQQYSFSLKIRRKEVVTC